MEEEITLRQITDYKERSRSRLTENQRRALDVIVRCGANGMGTDYPDHYDPCGCSPCPSSQAASQTQAELKQVSACCQADFFRDGDRVVCNACRLGTKLIHVSAT